MQQGFFVADIVADVEHFLLVAALSYRWFQIIVERALGCGAVFEGFKLGIGLNLERDFCYWSHDLPAFVRLIESADVRLVRKVFMINKINNTICVLLRDGQSVLFGKWINGSL